mgnify:FL=1
MFVASSSSLILCWVGLELNTAGFIPFLLKENFKGLRDSGIKYFLTQALASVFFLLRVTFTLIFSKIASFSIILLIVSLFIKLGAAPFHSWLIRLVESLDWGILFLLLTIQKINPLLILMNQWTNAELIWSIVCISVLVGRLAGLTQTRLRKLISLSSVNHLGWFLAAINQNFKLLVIYFFTYMLLLARLIYVFSRFNVFLISQLSFVNIEASNLNLIFLNLLSLGGLPPFLGFFPKWIVLENLIWQGFTIVSLVMIISSLIVLYFYLRITFSAFILKKLGWGQFKIKSSLRKSLIFLNLLSLGGLPLIFLI